MRPLKHLNMFARQLQGVVLHMAQRLLVILRNSEDGNLVDVVCVLQHLRDEQIHVCLSGLLVTKTINNIFSQNKSRPATSQLNRLDATTPWRRMTTGLWLVAGGWC